MQFIDCQTCERISFVKTTCLCLDQCMQKNNITAKDKLLKVNHQ